MATLTALISSLEADLHDFEETIHADFDESAFASTSSSRDVAGEARTAQELGLVDLRHGEHRGYTEDDAARWADTIILRVAAHRVVGD